MNWSRLSEDFRGRVRFFTFLIGNGGLVPDNIEELYDYESLLVEKPELLPSLFAIYLNNFQANTNGSSTSNPIERAAEWLYQFFNPDYDISSPVEDWELAVVTNNQVTNCIVTFVYHFIEGALDTSVFNVAEYKSALFEGGSFFEGVISVFLNVIEVDTNENVRNISRAERRAQQFARQWVDRDFKVEPPFEDWEVELV